MPSPLEELAALLRGARVPEREDGWLTAGEVAEQLGDSEPSVSARLRRQARAGLVECRKASVMTGGGNRVVNVYRVKP